MADDDWISVAEAARIVRIADACAFINWGWKRKLIPLRGLPIGGGELVDIPSNEGGKIDCRKSRVVTGRLFTTYQHVITRRADLERLAQVRAPPSQPLNASSAGIDGDVAAVSTRDANSVSEAPSKQAPQDAANALVAEEVSELTQELATELLRLFPEGRPRNKRRYDIFELLQAEASKKIGAFSMRAMDRAIR